MYTNQRILTDNKTNAKEGKVVLSPTKIVWMVSMLLIAILGGWYTFSFTALFVFIFTTSLSLCFGHSLGMHRRLIHKSYQCPQWFEYLCVHLGVIVGLAGPMGMIKTHDTRDWAQRQSDCHDYFGHKQSMLKDFFWQVFCDIQLKYPPSYNIESDVAKNRVYQWMEKSWMLQQVPLALVLYWFGGLPWVVWGISVRVCVSVVGHWLIGYYAHNHGERNWHVDQASVQGYNVPFAALITMGESYHNNHHAFPGSANFALEKGQFDLGWVVLKGLAQLGLVWDLVLPQQLPKRAELVRISGQDKN